MNKYVSANNISSDKEDWNELKKRLFECPLGQCVTLKGDTTPRARCPYYFILKLIEEKTNGK